MAVGETIGPSFAEGVVAVTKRDEWWKLLESAQKGEADAQHTVGNFYEYGLRDENGGVILEPDMKEAVRWHHKAAESDCAPDPAFCEVFLHVVVRQIDRPNFTADRRIRFTAKSVTCGAKNTEQSAAFFQRSLG